MHTWLKASLRFISYSKRGLTVIPFLYECTHTYILTSVVYIRTQLSAFIESCLRAALMEKKVTKKKKNKTQT